MALSKGCLFGLVVVAIIAFIILLFGGYLMVKYNQMVKLDESINGAWADVDNQLLRRISGRIPTIFLALSRARK